MASRHFFRDTDGSAAEFAIILPVALAFMFGIIDGGRYLWEVNRAEKATQAGARIAAVTAMIPQGVADRAYAIDDGLPQGSPVGDDAFTAVVCVGTSNTTVACDWDPDPDTPYNLEPAGDSFALVLQRMRCFLPRLQGSDVSIRYSNSGLGFAGDPAGPDVAPLITVRLNDVQFEPILTGVFGLTWGLPSAAYTLPQEDGAGSVGFEQHEAPNGLCP